MLQNKQKQSQETKQASEPNSDMTQVLEWSYMYIGFEITDQYAKEPIRSSIQHTNTGG